MKRTLIVVFGFAIAGTGIFYVLSMPDPLTADQLPAVSADLANGELMFWAGGCRSCHAAPGAEDNELTLSGGMELPTPFGTFRSPNISPDPDAGIGRWSTLEFINAMVRGLSPQLEHYYPAFPYPHYQNMTFGDLIDLKGYLDTLPGSSNRVAEHALAFPYSLRRGIGLWKWRYLSRNAVVQTSAPSAEVERGRYLVNGAGHCGACHTPRDEYGGDMPDRFLSGAEAIEIAEGPDGQSVGRIPNITPHPDGIGAWSEKDIEYSLESGFDPDFDSFGGTMVEVQENMARLPAADRAAIAAYLKSIPALPSDSP